jgi:hypothetical protein
LVWTSSRPTHMLFPQHGRARPRPSGTRPLRPRAANRRSDRRSSGPGPCPQETGGAGGFAGTGKRGNRCDSGQAPGRPRNLLSATSRLRVVAGRPGQRWAQSCHRGCREWGARVAPPRRVRLSSGCRGFDGLAAWRGFLCRSGARQGRARWVSDALAGPQRERPARPTFPIAFPAAPSERRKPRVCRASVGTATGIRTRVSAVRGRRPSPLDDGGPADDCSRAPQGPLVPSVG